MKKEQNKKISDNFNVGTGRSIKISHLYQIIKNRVPNNSKIIRKKLEKFDPKKSSGKLEKIKKNFSELLKDLIHKQAASLNCVNVDPRVFSKAGVPFIDFGHLDGIKMSDMFVIKSNSAKKTYLKIVEIKDHETEVEIVSQQENMASINGKIVELVVGS